MNSLLLQLWEVLLSLQIKQRQPRILALANESNKSLPSAAASGRATEEPLEWARISKWWEIHKTHKSTVRLICFGLTNKLPDGARTWLGNYLFLSEHLVVDFSCSEGKILSGLRSGGERWDARARVWWERECRCVRNWGWMEYKWRKRIKRETWWICVREKILDIKTVPTLCGEKSTDLGNTEAVISKRAVEDPW